MRGLFLALSGALIIVINARIRSAERPAYQRTYASRGVVIGIVMVAVGLFMLTGG